ncbi:MAG: slipin family protein [Chloroflexi bacterium]|nr:slipin family protein [Chloroflexota bacterium]
MLPIVVIVVLAVLWAALGIKVVRQWEQGVHLRFGRFIGLRNPGFNMIIPVVDNLVKVSQRIITIVLEPQEVITRDNVTIKVDAVVYFRVADPAKAVIQVEDYFNATTQIALTTLRSVLGQSDLDELLAHRDRINDRLKTIIDEQTETPWGVKVTVAEVKDVLLPENMQRAMARQAEAEREKRAKIVHAEGERAASGMLAEAADVLEKHPASLQLRYLQTMVEMAGERNSTIIPIPVEMLGLAKGLAALQADGRKGANTPAPGTRPT